MIEVWISGRARRAVVDDGQDVRLLRYGAPDEFEPCSPRQVDVLRDAGAAELRVLARGPEPRALHTDLARAVAADRACADLETLLDAGFSHDTRRATAQELEALVGDEAVARSAVGFLHDAPLAFAPDTRGALEICQAAGAVRVGGIIAQYDARLMALRAAWDAWDELARDADLSLLARRWFAAHGGFAELAADVREPSRHGFGLWLVEQAPSAPRELGHTARTLRRLQTLLRGAALGLRLVRRRGTRAHGRRDG